jgi:hypothetical protein
MSSIEQYKQYAEEALLSASQSKTESERLGFIDLANTFAKAAFQTGRDATRLQTKLAADLSAAPTKPNPVGAAQGGM